MGLIGGLIEKIGGLIEKNPCGNATSLLEIPSWNRYRIADREMTDGVIFKHLQVRNPDEDQLLALRGS